jgi:stage II sporulation protein AA (anti-sigma F factor antagonist)
MISKVLSNVNSFFILYWRHPFLTIFTTDKLYNKQKGVKKMSVKIEFENEVLLCRLCGEIDHHTTLPIRLDIDDRIENCRPQTVILDFSDVTFMDSSGIGLVMGRYKLLNEFGGVLEITGLSNNSYKVMRLAGLDRIANIKKGDKKQ